MKWRYAVQGFGLAALIRHVSRRQAWFIENLTPHKLLNLLLAIADFALKREVSRALPVVLKVDISPLCNLRCTICVHARPGKGSNDLLQGQRFAPHQRMSPSEFEQIVDQVAGRTMAVSLYYVGDPLTHPALDEICRLAWKKGLNSHVSSNFSFVLTDERIQSLVCSGLTHLTVCVDGLTQETYGRTRVGGRIDLVLDNLERVARCRSQLGRKYPRLEVQFIKFQHNLHEVAPAAERCRALGVDQFTEIWGGLHNYADFTPGSYRVGAPKRKRRLPQCFWPHFAMQIKYNGDVIPCCSHRVAMQYHETAETRGLGNVLANPLRDVWNAPAYRAVRRFVSNPQRLGQEPALAETFCHGCPTIFETDADAQLRMADRYRWEDLYQIDGRGRVARRSPAAHTPEAAPGASLASPASGS